MSPAPTGRIGRIARLGRLTGRVGGSYLVQKVKGAFQEEGSRLEALRRLDRENAERIADTLGLLKGAAMKLGQTVAQAAASLDLPDDVMAVLGRLHAGAEPVPFPIIKEDVERSLERSLERAFRRFDPEPVGTASLGQAHAATLPDGRPVVVKVLHRGIEESVASDLAALRTLLRTGGVLRRDRKELDAIFDEIRERLEEELDYLAEAANLEEFGRRFADDHRVRIPRVHAGWSTDRVLTMDHLPGVPLDRFLHVAGPMARQRAGTTLADVLFTMAFRHRALHADPHPGNYLFELDGTVGLLDFGCVKRFDEYWIASYARAALAAVDQRQATFMDAARDLGVLQGDDPAAMDALWASAQVIVGPLQEPRYTIGGRHDPVLDRLAPAARRLVIHHADTVQAPPDLVYLHRALGGTYTILRRLVVRADFGNLLRPHAEHAISVAEGRVPA